MRGWGVVFLFRAEAWMFAFLTWFRVGFCLVES